MKTRTVERLESVKVELVTCDNCGHLFKEKEIQVIGIDKLDGNYQKTKMICDYCSKALFGYNRQDNTVRKVVQELRERQPEKGFYAKFGFWTFWIMFGTVVLIAYTMM